MKKYYIERDRSDRQKVELNSLEVPVDGEAQYIAGMIKAFEMINGVLRNGDSEVFTKRLQLVKEEDGGQKQGIKEINFTESLAKYLSKVLKLQTKFVDKRII